MFETSKIKRLDFPSVMYYIQQGKGKRLGQFQGPVAGNTANKQY